MSDDASVDKPVINPVGAPVDNAASDEALRLAHQKKRNIWLGLALFGFVVLIAVVSALRLAENIQTAAGG